MNGGTDLVMGHVDWAAPPALLAGSARRVSHRVRRQCLHSTVQRAGHWKATGRPNLHLPRLITKPRKKHKMGHAKGGGGTQVADVCKGKINRIFPKKIHPCIKTLNSRNLGFEKDSFKDSFGQGPYVKDSLKASFDQGP